MMKTVEALIYLAFPADRSILAKMVVRPLAGSGVRTGPAAQVRGMLAQMAVVRAVKGR